MVSKLIYDLGFYEYTDNLDLETVYFNINTEIILSI